jgi:hypothetical protein
MSAASWAVFSSKRPDLSSQWNIAPPLDDLSTSRNYQIERLQVKHLLLKRSRAG